MQFVNKSGDVVTVEDLGLVVKPGEVVEIADGYAKPRRKVNGGRAPAIIEMLAPQLKPADPDEEAVWLEAPEPPVPAPPTLTAKMQDLIATGIAPKVAELIAKGEAAKAKRGK